MIPRIQLNQIKPYIAGKYKEGAFKLASNENPLGPSPKAMDAINSFVKKIYLYPDGNCTSLKEKLAEKLSLSPDNFVIGNGSDELLLFTAGAYVSETDEILTAQATFSEYTFVSQLFGGKMRYVPMNEGEILPSRFLDYVNDKTKAVFLCNPNNPTGSYFSHEKLEDFLKKIPKHLLVVLDEAYVEYAQASDFPNSLALLKDHRNLLILRTFSKIYGLAGLRIGYGIGSPEITTNLNKAREPFSVNSLAQTAALSALDDREFIEKSILVNEQGKKYLYGEFDTLKLRYYPTQANFIFVHINKDCTDTFLRLMDLGVTIRPLKSFGFDKAIRVTVGTREQNEFFISCLRKVL